MGLKKCMNNANSDYKMNSTVKNKLKEKLMKRKLTTRGNC